MVDRYGSDATFAGNVDGGIADSAGNLIISGATGVGDAPLGYAAINQIVGKFPNALLNFPPPTLGSAIGNFDNPLPYWNVTDESDGRISAKFIVLDASVSSAIKNTISGAGGGSNGGSYVGLGGLEINPTNALSGDTLTLSQRAPIAVIPKMKEIGWGVYGYTGPGTPTVAFYVQTDVIYYDGEGAAISTATLGSTTNFAMKAALYDGAVHTGYTAGTAATAYVSDAATEVEMISKLVVTAGTVTQSQRIYISSMVISPEAGGSATPAEGRVVLVYQSSDTWVVPSNVYAMDVMAFGAGGGGAGGGLSIGLSAANLAGTARGGPGGGASGYAFAPNVGLVPGGTVTITIGSGGVGGTALIYNKPAGTASADSTTNPTTGGNGGSTSVSMALGTVISITGGGGAGTATVGSPGVVTVNAPAPVSIAAGTAASSATTLMTSPASSAANLFPPLLQPNQWSQGVPGDTGVDIGSGSPTFGAGGTVYPETGYSAGGAWGGSAVTTTTSSAAAQNAQAGGAGRYGANGGGGGAALRMGSEGPTNPDFEAGDGLGYPAGGLACGGSGGGGARINRGSPPGGQADITASNIYVESGIGGDGATGYVVIAYTTPGPIL